MADAPLTGYRVVDLSIGVAGGYCTKVLADGGATVVKLEAPEGDPLRRWSASGAEIAPDDDGALFQYLGGSKRSVVADPDTADGLELARTLVASADAVVWSRGSRLAEHAELSPRRLRVLAPHAPVVAITPFGLEGPWADRPATEFTLQAWCGGLQRGSADRPPVAAGGDLVWWAAGMFAANGLLASRVRALDTGAGELLDVSMLESAILSQTMYQVTYRTIAGRPMRTGRSINFPGIEKTKDGWVGFMVVTGQQWFDFCVMVEKPEWMDESLILFEQRLFRRDELGPAISQWMLGRTTDDIIELATALRVPVSPIGNGATVTRFDQFVERKCYLENPRGGFLQPDVPYTLSSGAARRAPEPAPRLGEHTGEEQANRREPASPLKPVANTADRLPFEGLRVADFTAFWAGPIVGHFLAMLGAEVIHVESTKRPDGMRFSAARPMTEDQFWEWSPLYQGCNTGKLGVTIDMESARGQELARDLLATCDVVVDNYSPRVMEAWNLTYDELVKLRPDIIQVRAPAFGLSGPWRDRVGYAQTMEQASGMAWVTGYPDQEPQVPNGPCDPLGGTHTTIALLLALEHRRRTGKGMLVEVPQVGGALSIAAEQVVEHSAYGALLEREGNRGPHAAPQGVYRTADVDDEGAQDRWIAIAVETDAHWEALRRALGDPGWATSPGLATAAGRRTAADDLDRGIAEWCAGRKVDDAVAELWAAGVPVAKVLLQHEQDEVPQLEARGFWEDLEHPVTGVNRHSGYPVRFSAGPQRVHHRPAPMLGEHNRRILGGLGCSDREIDELEAEGVIGTRLVMPT